MLRNSRVLARCDEAGNLAAEDGRVEIRYRPNDGRAYRAAVGNLEVVEGASVLPGDACEEAVFMGAAKRKRKRPSDAKTKRTESEKDDSASAVVAYTDGACSGNPGPAGLGVVLKDGAKKQELSHYLGRATNNIAELTAIKCALEAIGATERPVQIYTDSRYAIGILSKGWNAKANQTLIAEIKRTLKSFRDLHLIYVPGHSGHPLNERADELARQAIRESSSQGWMDVQ